MSLFVCSKCGCVENTALGLWWVRGNPEYFKWDSENEQYKGKGLCSECMPVEFSDCSGKHGNGKWHNRFPKQTLQEFMNNPGEHSARDYYRHIESTGELVYHPNGDARKYIKS